jgi:hypothetical protein
VNKQIVERGEMHTYMVTKRDIAIPLNMRKIDVPATIERHEEKLGQNPQLGSKG